MSKRVLWLSGVFIFVAGLSTGFVVAGKLAATESPRTKILLDNTRVIVTEVTTPASAKRESYTRPTDQIIVFIDEANYEAIDAEGSKQARGRKPGEIVWHNRGEIAPTLVNKGKQYRNLIIALK